MTRSVEVVRSSRMDKPGFYSHFIHNLLYTYHLSGLPRCFVYRLRTSHYFCINTRQRLGVTNYEYKLMYRYIITSKMQKTLSCHVGDVCIIKPISESIFTNFLDIFCYNTHSLTHGGCVQEPQTLPAFSSSLCSEQCPLLTGLPSGLWRSLCTAGTANLAVLSFAFHATACTGRTCVVWSYNSSGGYALTLVTVF